MLLPSSVDPPEPSFDTIAGAYIGGLNLPFCGLKVSSVRSVIAFVYATLGRTFPGRRLSIADTLRKALLQWLVFLLRWAPLFSWLANLLCLMGARLLIKKEPPSLATPGCMGSDGSPPAGGGEGGEGTEGAGERTGQGGGHCPFTGLPGGPTVVADPGSQHRRRRRRGPSWCEQGRFLALLLVVALQFVAWTALVLVAVLYVGYVMAWYIIWPLCVLLGSAVLACAM